LSAARIATRSSRAEEESAGGVDAGAAGGGEGTTVAGEVTASAAGAAAVIIAFVAFAGLGDSDGGATDGITFVAGATLGGGTAAGARYSGEGCGEGAMSRCGRAGGSGALVIATGFAVSVLASLRSAVPLVETAGVSFAVRGSSGVSRVSIICSGRIRVVWTTVSAEALVGVCGAVAVSVDVGASWLPSAAEPLFAVGGASPALASMSGRAFGMSNAMWSRWIHVSQPAALATTRPATTAALVHE